MIDHGWQSLAKYSSVGQPSRSKCPTKCKKFSGSLDQRLQLKLCKYLCAIFPQIFTPRINICIKPDFTAFKYISNCLHSPLPNDLLSPYTLKSHPPVLITYPNSCISVCLSHTDVCVSLNIGRLSTTKWGQILNIVIHVLETIHIYISNHLYFCSHKNLEKGAYLFHLVWNKCVHLFNKTRMSGTLFFVQFLSDLDEVWQIGGPWDPINMKNTEVWLPWQLLLWEWKNSLKQSLRSWCPQDLARKFVRHSERTLGHWFP